MTNSDLVVNLRKKSTNKNEFSNQIIRRRVRSRGRGIVLKRDSAGNKSVVRAIGGESVARSFSREIVQLRAFSSGE